MKKRLNLSIFTLILLFAYGTSFATIYRVNNMGATGTNVYDDLTNAITDASAGDTILIEGSHTAYGDITLTKQLVIFGPGYYLAENPETQANKLTAKIGNITFNVGSENSKVSGCVISTIAVNADNITISRNYVSATYTVMMLTINSVDNLILEQNILWGRVEAAAGKTPTVMIRNNVIGRLILPSSTVSATVMNNFFSYNFIQTSPYPNNSRTMIDVNNTVFVSNIVHSYSTNVVMNFNAAQNNTIDYNVLNQAAGTYTGGDNNLFAQTMAQVYTQNTSDYKLDNQFKLVIGSTAETAAQDGGQCGIFGGTHAYVLSGLPPIPHIYSLEADPAGTNTDPLNVTISVKSQN